MVCMSRSPLTPPKKLAPSPKVTNPPTDTNCTVPRNNVNARPRHHTKMGGAQNDTQNDTHHNEKRPFPAAVEVAKPQKTPKMAAMTLKSRDINFGNVVLLSGVAGSSPVPSAWENAGSNGPEDQRRTRPEKH